VLKESSFTKKPNFKTYQPTNAGPDGPNYMPMNMQLLVRVDSQVKLNLIDSDGNSMISQYGENSSKESHFMLLESITDRYELNWRVIYKVFNKFRNPSLTFEEWVLVDFDNCLKGNPITDE
jgi:hypothetical protein